MNCSIFFVAVVDVRFINKFKAMSLVSSILIYVVWRVSLQQVILRVERQEIAVTKLCRQQHNMCNSGEQAVEHVQ